MSRNYNTTRSEYFIGSHIKLTTVRHEVFAGVNFCGLATFCILWDLIFATRTDWFFLLGINFCDFQKAQTVPSTQH